MTITPFVFIIINLDIPAQPTEKYTLTWIEGTRIYKCYGCNRDLRPKPAAKERAMVPPVLFDVLLGRKELRMYRKPGGELTYSVQPQTCYFEIKKKCVLKKNPQFSSDQVQITQANWEKLTDMHKNLLKKEFGITGYSE